MTVSAQATERRRKPHWSLARTWLLQPGIPGGGEAYDEAGSADAVVLDIEDGLPDAQKHAGRVSVAAWLNTGAHAETINRLLRPSSPDIDEARRALARLDAPAGPYDGSVGPTRARAQAVLDLAEKLGLS